MIGLLLALSTAHASWPTGDDPAPWTAGVGGMQIQDLVVGTGTMVEDHATAEVHYTGMLADGTVFDSSIPRGETFSFKVGDHAVIRGWEEGLLGMRVGGKRRLVIPPDMAYGSRSTGPIPANSTLYFEIELLGVVEPRRPPTAIEVPADGAWRALEGGARYADVRAGDGKKAKMKHRVCLDWVKVEGGEIVEETYSRGRCTWMRLEESALPQGWLLAMPGLRIGGIRLVEIPPAMGKDPKTHAVPDDVVVVRVELSDTGK